MAATKQIFNDLNLVIRLNQHIEAIATSDDATAAALLSKQTSFKVLAELDAIRNPDSREDAQFDHQRASFLAEAEDNGASPPQLPFHLQGDQEFNKASAIAERRALQRSECIRSKVLFLWDVARGKKNAETSRTASLDVFMQLQTQAPGANPKNANSANTIDEKDYMDMMLLIFKVLRDDFVLDLAQLQVHCDWEVDSHHGNSLGFEQFYSAVFELVDLWTCDILEATYVRFLELLARRITLRVIIFLDDMKLKLALSDNFDDAVVVKAIPLSTIQRFASVAKIVEKRGVRTVGDLASADPQMVESERLAYVEKNNFSKEKIGAKLQHLLDSLQTLSEQFDPTNSSDRYTLEDMKLVRHHAVDPIGAGAGGDPRTASIGLHNLNGQGNQQAHPDGGMLSGSQSTGASFPAFSSDDAANGSTRGSTRRLSIHDLSQAESGIINSLRSAFLLEKRISIHRKHDVDAVREELEKFGVDPRSLSDPEALEKYGGLYEMFVLRDGESIKTLAQTMLTQIKLELQAHGVIVDDEDAESVYDGFYGSVVASSGDAIVKDAQNWVDDTVKTQSVASYIKADYHELKPLNQVMLIGSQPGDEEFVSLLSSDEEEDEEEEEQPPAALEDSKPKSLSPIQRKPTQMRIKQHAPPPIQISGLSSASEERGHEKTPRHKAERPAATPPPSSSTSLRRRSGPRIETKATESPAGDTKKRKKSKDHDELHNKHQTHSLPASESQERRRSRQHAEPGPVAELLPADNGGAQLGEVDTSVGNTDSDTSGIEETIPIAVAPVQERPPVDDNSASQRRPSVSLRTMTPKVHLTVDTSHAVKGSDTANNDVDREAQGVEFGYEEEVPSVIESEPVQQEVIMELVPKVPKIVIGTGADGANIPVAARYIQLLGLGTVLTASDEDALYQMLQSDDGKDVDLVCFDIGSQLDTAVEKLGTLQAIVGKRVIVLGGDAGDPEKTKAVADACLALGAIYFAALPINFPALRTEILAFFENSTQPFILRQRKPAAGGGAAAAFKMASRSIGAAGLFGMHDASRKLSTPPSYANIAKSSSPKRKPTNPGATPLSPTAGAGGGGSSSPSAAHAHLPSLVKEVTHLIHLKAIDDLRASETVFIPTSPRSLKSYKKSSPRLSVALKKMMR